jgi:hypothetical protein
MTLPKNADKTKITRARIQMVYRRSIGNDNHRGKISRSKFLSRSASAGV